MVVGEKRLIKTQCT
ncbi:unnamed protein product [Victoria cruziana]